MPDSCRISELPAVSSLNNGDLVEVSQVDSLSASGYTSKKSPMSELGNKLNNSIQYASALQTTDKTVIGAINEVASNLYLPDTSSGSIATFTTSLEKPLVGCECGIVASGGGGTPTTPIPIVGYTGMTITRNDGENPPVEEDTYSVSWQDQAGTIYGGSLNVTSGVLTKTFEVVDMSTLNWYYNTANTRWYTADLKDIAVLSPNDPTFIAEQWNTHAWTGRTDGDIACDNSGYVVCETNDNVLRPAGLLVYELKTPQTYQLTPTEIETLANSTNNVFCDTTGNTSVTYLETIKEYIDKRVTP